MSVDPRQDILEIEAKVREICLRTGKDPAEGAMMLLTAAVHMSDTYSKGPFSETGPVVASALGHAIVAADDMFTLRRVTVEKKR